MANPQDMSQYLNLHGLGIFKDEILSIIDDKIAAAESDDFSVASFTSTIYFPVVGDSKTIYLETTNKRLYLWDSEQLKYFCYGSDYTAIKKIDGGDASDTL